MKSNTDSPTETAEPPAVQWSFSAFKRFDNCPRQYHELNVLKRYVQKDTEALRTGKHVHKIAEDFIRDGTPVPDTHVHLLPMLRWLADLSGDKYVEYEMAVTPELVPCGFNDETRWWRGIADLIVVDAPKERALLVDYKTGSGIRYADTGQLHLLAASIFLHFPEVDYISGSLLFVNLDQAVPAQFYRKDLDSMWARWRESLSRLEAAFRSDVWNPRPGPLCKFCPVTSCEYHRG